MTLKVKRCLPLIIVFISTLVLLTYALGGLRIAAYEIVITPRAQPGGDIIEDTADSASRTYNIVQSWQSQTNNVTGEL